MWDLATDSVAIAFLRLLEVFAIAKSIANQTGQTLDFNRQCLAEGLANLVGGFFQCLPGSGSLSRSAINFQAGRGDEIFRNSTAAFVAIAVLELAPLARYVPKPALAALLLLTAARLIDLKRVSYTLRASRMDAGVVIVTALSAVVFGLDAAILIGVALSILLFVPRAAKMRTVEMFVDNDDVVRERFFHRIAEIPAFCFTISKENCFSVRDRSLSVRFMKSSVRQRQARAGIYYCA